MRTKILTLAVAALAGLTLGAGIGVAVAQTDDGASTGPVDTFESMDEMHAAMRDQMPADLAEECDALHASMSDDMRGLDPDDMGSMMDGSTRGGWMAGRHAEHHGG